MTQSAYRRTSRPQSADPPSRPNLVLGINGSPQEYIRSADLLTSHSMVVVRGPAQGRSEYIDDLIECEIVARTVNIVEYDRNDDPIGTYTLSGAYISSVADSPDGSGQAATFVCDSISVD